jgi:hypothetical protein
MGSFIYKAKLYTFLKQLDKLVQPGDTQAIIYSKAKIAAQFSNDAFGGQDWVGYYSKNN